MKRFLCILLSCILVCLTASCGKTPQVRQPDTQSAPASPQPEYTASPGMLQKKEAVFVTLSPDGTVERVEVTDRLITDVPQVQVHDVSILNNIRNLKGSETPVRDGVEVTWHMQKTQLYYGGDTDKPLPVVLHIRYTLDGQPISAAALRGKQGHVRIEITAQNRTGSDFVPFVLAGGLLLPTGAADVAVENGGSVGDGSRDVAFGVMLPGLGEALALPQQISLPESFAVSFSAEDCALGSMYFVMAPLSTAKLSDAIGALFGSAQMPELDLAPLLSAVRQIGADGTLAESVAQAAQSAPLFGAVRQAMQAYARTQPLLDVLQKYLTSENAQLLQDTIDALGGESLAQYAALLQNPVFLSWMADMRTVSDAFTQLIPQMTAMIAELGSPEAREAIAALPDALQQLQSLAQALETNGEWLTALSDLAQSGILSQANTLLQSVQEVLESGALESLQTLSGRAEQLETRLNAVLEAGKKYGVFSSAPKDAVTSVYFVFKTRA